jgi:outer membrane protein TolC
MLYLYLVLTLSAKGIVPQELVELAWVYDSRIDQAELEYLASREAITTVAWDSPSVSASFAPLSIGNDVGVRVAIQQPLPSKGELGLQRDILQLQGQVDDLEMLMQRLQTQREVLYSYADFMEGTEQLVLLLAHEEILQEHARILQAQVNVKGDSALLYLDMEIERQEVLAEQYLKQFLVQKAQLRLRTLTGFDVSTEVSIVDAPSLLAEGISLQKQIVTEQILQQQLQVELANLNRSPQWSILSQYNNLVAEPSSHWMVGVGLDIPFQKKSISSEIQQQNLRVQALEQRQRWIVQQENNERLILLERWKTLAKQEQHWLTQIQLIEEQRQGLDGSFSTGEVDYVRLLQLEHKGIAAQQQLVQLKAERWRVFADWLSLNGEEWK